METKKMSPAEFVKYAAENHIKFHIEPDKREFPGQQCQDKDLTMEFRKLHHKIVNDIIMFCKNHNIIVDDVHMNIYDLPLSIKAGTWQACTDSSLDFYKFDDEYKKVFHEGDLDYIHTLSKKDMHEIEMRNNEPYMFSV